MKEFRTRDGPYPIRLLYETAEIDRICEDALRGSGRLPATPQPIEIDRFLEKFFEVRVVYDDLGEGAIGCTVFNRKGRVTGFLISNSIEADGTKSGKRRARATLAHEGGHGLLHPRLFMEDAGTGSLFGGARDDSPRILCREQDVTPVGAKPVYNGRWWEWQANRAIAGLLLPQKLVAAAIASLLSRDKIIHVLPEAKRGEAETLTAEMFDVNPAVARIRLQEMFPPSQQISL
jgi:hypothetical protein